MLLPTSCRLAAFLALLLAPVAAVAAEEHPIVAKARAYLGPEAALTAVRSVHYMGWFQAPDPADLRKQAPVAIDIVFQAPYRQRTTRTTESMIDTTALDSYDGWHRVQDPKDASRWHLQLLAKDQIRRQRAIAWENLAFFRGLEREGGKVLDQGSAKIDGIACQKLAFVYADDIIFYRYFDEVTGRLVLTETESGSTIREQGEIMVNGIRFPKTLVNTVKSSDGKTETITITFNKITVNEAFADSFFAVPSFTGR
jgi:hypothetical protein